MNGLCTIRFDSQMTRFTFTCPATPSALNEKPRYDDFTLPENAWAIGVDDSKIQRKLLGRVFEHVGVDSSRQLLLGESPDDIAELETTLNNFMAEHAGDQALIVVDEHLVSLLSHGHLWRLFLALQITLCLTFLFATFRITTISILSTNVESILDLWLRNKSWIICLKNIYHVALYL